MGKIQALEKGIVAKFIIGLIPIKNPHNNSLYLYKVFFSSKIAYRIKFC